MINHVYALSLHLKSLLYFSLTLFRIIIFFEFNKEIYSLYRHKTFLKFNSSATSYTSKFNFTLRYIKELLYNKAL